MVQPALREIVAAYPELAGIALARLWAGWIDPTPGAVPVISHIPSLPGPAIAAGFSGHGFGIGPAAGRLAAELAVGDQPIVDPTSFELAGLADGRPIRAPGCI